MSNPILISNATTAVGVKGKLDYGIPLAYQMQKEYSEIVGLELLLSWLPTAQYWRRLLFPSVWGIHWPWSYRFDPFGWNHEDSVANNIKGKIAYLTQASTRFAIRTAEKVGAHYQVVHPGAFAKMQARSSVPFARLKQVPGLAFENDWNPLGFRGVGVAATFARNAEAGVVIDTAHLLRVQSDLTFAFADIETAADNIVAVHVSDFDESRGDHLIPDRLRSAKLKAILDRIRSQKPKVPLVIEVLSDDPRRSVEGTIAFLQS